MTEPAIPTEQQRRTEPSRSDDVLPPIVRRVPPANENAKTALELDYVARWLLLF